MLPPPQPGPTHVVPYPMQTLSSFFGSLPGFSSARNLVANAHSSAREARPAADTAGAPAPEATQPQAQGEWPAPWEAGALGVDPSTGTSWEHFVSTCGISRDPTRLAHSFSARGNRGINKEGEWPKAVQPASLGVWTRQRLLPHSQPLLHLPSPRFRCPEDQGLGILHV